MKTYTRDKMIDIVRQYEADKEKPEFKDMNFKEWLQYNEKVIEVMGSLDAFLWHGISL